MHLTTVNSFAIVSKKVNIRRQCHSINYLTFLILSIESDVYRHSFPFSAGVICTEAYTGNGPTDINLSDVDYNGSVTITSPAYPFEYPSDSSCGWSITRGDPANKMRLTLDDFDVSI